MSVLTERITFPSSNKVFRIKQTAGEQLNLWALAAGQTKTYWSATALRVIDVLENGASLTSVSSIAGVEALEASYYWDQAAGRVYVHCTGDVAPPAKTIQAIVYFTFATEGRLYNNLYFDPRIGSFPALSMRIERVFGDPGQLGTGTVVYKNGDGFFDLLTGLQWDAGVIVLELGVDNPRPPYALVTDAEFEVVGTYNVKTWSKSDEEFKINVEEIKGDTKVKIPFEHYTRDEFPYMREEDVGKPKQIAYGQIFDIPPVCVHVSEKRFRVAAHAIQGFFGIRMKSAVTGYWVDTVFGTIDNTLAEFTVPDWDMKAEIAVDFFGKTNLDGTLMDNPAAVVKDLLITYLGYTLADIQ